MRSGNGAEGSPANNGSLPEHGPPYGRGLSGSRHLRCIRVRRSAALERRSIAGFPSPASSIQYLESGAKPMQQAWRSIRATAVMAAIVTTMLCGPVGALLALLSFAVLGISLHSFVTFGDRFNALGGLL